MSADPIPTTPAAPPRAPAAGEPLVEFVRTQRANAAYVLLGLAAAFLAAAVFLASKGEKAGGTAPPPPAVDPMNPDAPPPPPPEIENPKKGDYRIGWIACGVGFLITAGAGTSLLAGLPKRTEAEQRSHARAFVLTVGALLGAALILAGAFYFYRWSESLTKLLDGDRKETQWVVTPLLLVVAGAGMVFAAIQPARAEERHHQTLRRLVYGANLGLTVLLLGIGLVVLNIAFTLKVPSMLDTTESGFYSLSDSTKATVAKLAEPVTAYVILPDSGDREINDVRQLMYSTQEASGGRFTPRFVSPVTNKDELKQLQEKYPKVEKAAMGVLLTAGGEESKRHEFIPANDLFKQDFAPGGGQKVSFVGEAAMVQKLRYLADPDKAVVYFTQGNGELALAGGGPGGFAKADREASQLKTHLETNNVDVRALEFKEGGKAEVPADADVVVVADPMTPLPEPAVKALKDFMGRPGPKKGKMVLLAEARPGLGGKDRKMAKTGLEGLATEFGVKLGEQFVYSYPIAQYQLGPKDAIVMFAGGKGEAHPIVQPFARSLQAMFWTLPREVTPLSAAPGSPFTVTPLMNTLPDRPTWLEDEVLDDPRRAFLDMRESEPLRSRKQLTDRPRNVAVAVSEGGAPPPNPMNPHSPPPSTAVARMVVFANGEMFSNDAPRPRGGGTPPTHELMSASIDWLRDRAVIAPGVDAKPYSTFQLPPAETLNETRLVYLPLGLAMLAVAGLGAGVWVIRRK